MRLLCSFENDYRYAYLDRNFYLSRDCKGKKIRTKVKFTTKSSEYDRDQLTYKVTRNTVLVVQYCKCPTWEDNGYSIARPTRTGRKFSQELSSIQQKSHVQDRFIVLFAPDHIHRSEKPGVILSDGQNPGVPKYSLQDRDEIYGLENRFYTGLSPRDLDDIAVGLAPDVDWVQAGENHEPEEPETETEDAPEEEAQEIEVEVNESNPEQRQVIVYLPDSDSE
ncbi:hypothetical protein SEMRO_12_G009030.1 [Seminavis robusta]|uniref:Uncharacterized protein n=1 Tax=Seminavis robusta TaxID=568900 RepID=A0A9N8H001_9STRA|nr:hypothetical protein SEMRO_12_G009030.1 [Seminavis robusta]|eukprot:Sro12_g009030.1 n/a (222) ;mRNA; f:4297-4962